MTRSCWLTLVWSLSPSANTTTMISWLGCFVPMHVVISYCCCNNTVCLQYACTLTIIQFYNCYEILHTLFEILQLFVAHVRYRLIYLFNYYQLAWLGQIHKHFLNFALNYLFLAQKMFLNYAHQRPNNWLFYTFFCSHKETSDIAEF